MVYYSKTYRLCHGLTKRGETEYERQLSLAADDLLLRHQHPFRWLKVKILDILDGLRSK